MSNYLFGQLRGYSVFELRQTATATMAVGLLSTQKQDMYNDV